MRKSRLIWFGHGMRREGSVSDVEEIVMRINVKGRSGKRRLEKRWLNKIESDMKTAGVCVKCFEYQAKWRSRTRDKVGDPK